jgi:hypothetical protein
VSGHPDPGSRGHVQDEVGDIRGMNQPGSTRADALLHFPAETSLRRGLQLTPARQMKYILYECEQQVRQGYHPRAEALLFGAVPPRGLRRVPRECQPCLTTTARPSSRCCFSAPAVYQLARPVSFGYSSSHASKARREDGVHVILVEPNIVEAALAQTH